MTGKSEKKNDCEKKLEEMQAAMEEMETKLADAETKAGEYLDMARRLQADFDNYRRRTDKEKEDFKKFATADIATEVLSVTDDLERALSHVDKDSELAIGVKAIQNNLMKILQSRGITEIAVEGKFDPNCHEALCVCEGDTDGEVVEVFQKGYKMGDRILRYAKVMVTKAKQEDEDKCQE